jgi:hypothetical protein
MALTANSLRKQVDLPTWEWLRQSPNNLSATTGLSCTCVADNTNFNDISGRYIYNLINASNFWRYDTVADTYEQLASPPNAPLTATSMRFAGAQGYYNRVISATSTTIRTGLPSGQAALGYRIRIVSGKGAGQERLITAVSDPIVSDYGNATSGSGASLVDTNKAWALSYTGTSANLNEYAGYCVRILYGSGANQVRKILYNSATTLTIGDATFIQNDPLAGCTWTAAAAGSIYQIESNTITVDTAWDTTPDNTSRFVIMSGGVWMVSGASAAPYYTLQYYDVLHDMWYYKPAHQNMMIAAPSEVSLERLTENSTVWYQGLATSGSVTTIVDSKANWTTDQWKNYYVFAWSGTGRGQIAAITTNSATTLTVGTQSIAFDSTTRYQIMGYDAGKSSGTNTYNTFNDSSKSWTTDRWKNYAVRILYGTGAGQTRAISTNSSTALTVYRPWNILPDSTSVYAIQGDSDTMYIGWGGSSEIYMHNLAGGSEMLSHGRVYDSGVASIAAALLSDSSHTIYDYAPIAISGLAGTTTITATTAAAHNLKTGQYVSIRGVTSAAADQYNITGLVQITGVPSTTTFTYTPASAGTGTYAYLTALSVTSLSDASKDYRDNASSGTSTSITFTRATPSNINGWYASGTNITSGARVVSGAGTTTVVLSTGSATPSGVIIFSPWGPSTAVTGTYSSGGGAGVATVTLTGAPSVNVTGWYVSGTGITINTKVFSGGGTATIVLTNACSGAVSGTLTFYPPETAGRMLIMSGAAPTATTGACGTSIPSYITGSAAGVLTTITSTIPIAAASRYVICSTDLLGAGIDSQSTVYYSGVLLGTQSTTTAVDTNAFWATATGTGSIGSTTLTLSAAAPGSVNGWYISGTGITTGSQIVSGAGTTTLTLSMPIGQGGVAASGTMTCFAFHQGLVGRKLRLLSSTGINQELTLAAVTGSTGTLTFVTATAGATGATIYSLLSIPARGVGHELEWVYNNSLSTTKGKYLWVPRGNGGVGIDKLDLTTDRIVINYYVPIAETLGTGTYFAYDGGDRIYFTKDATLRMYYIDVNTHILHGAGVAPYASGTAQIGNKLEIFTTADGLKYLFFIRHGNAETFRQLIFY